MAPSTQPISTACKARVRGRGLRRRVHLSRHARLGREDRLSAAARPAVRAGDLRRAEGDVPARSHGVRRAGRAAASRRVHRGGRADGRRRAGRAGQSREPGRRCCSSCGRDRPTPGGAGPSALSTEVRAHYSIERSADRLLEVYRRSRGEAAACSEVAHVTKQYPTPKGPLTVVVGRDVHAGAGRGRGHHRAVGQRQELAALHAGRAGAADQGHASARGPGPVRPRAGGAGRVSQRARSGSCSRTTACCRSARCSRTCWCRRWSRPRAEAVRSGPTTWPMPRACCRTSGCRDRLDHRPGRAVGRRTPARGRGPGAGPPAAAAAVRRAHRQPGSGVSRCRGRAAAGPAPVAAQHPGGRDAQRAPGRDVSGRGSRSPAARARAGRARERGFASLGSVCWPRFAGRADEAHADTNVLRASRGPRMRSFADLAVLVEDRPRVASPSDRRCPRAGRRRGRRTASPPPKSIAASVSPPASWQAIGGGKIRMQGKGAGASASVTNPGRRRRNGRTHPSRGPTVTPNSPSRWLDVKAPPIREVLGIRP